MAFIVSRDKLDEVVYFIPFPFEVPTPNLND
jgi:hypothetical protein